MKLLQKSLAYIFSIFKSGNDLPEIPDAQPIGTPQIQVKEKHVTFSPAREYIPDYSNDGVTPLKLISELQQICPDQKLIDLYKIVEELKEHLEDAKNENARLLKENRILMGHQ